MEQEHGVVGDQDSDPENEICCSPIALSLAEIRRRFRTDVATAVGLDLTGSEGLEGAGRDGVT